MPRHFCTGIYNGAILAVMLTINVSNSKTDLSGVVSLCNPSDSSRVMSVSDESERCGFSGDGENNKLGKPRIVSHDDDIMSQRVGGKEQNNYHSSPSTSGSVTQTLIDLASHFLTTTLE